MKHLGLPFSELPFTRYGSYFVVSLEDDGEIYIRDLHGGDPAPSRLYRLRFDSRNIKDAEVEMSETRLVFRFAGTSGFCGISIGNDDTLHMLCTGCIARLEALDENRYDSLVPLDKNRWEHIFYVKNLKLMILGEGNFSVNTDWQIIESKNSVILMDGSEKPASVVIKSYKSLPDCIPAPDFEAAAKSAGMDFAAWSGKQAGDEYDRAARYILWGNFVRAEGCLKYDAMYANKLTMNDIWSWDNCFSAIALAKNHPRQALEQLLGVFEQQDAYGALPDSINDAFAVYTFVKPPIYGFTVNRLREKNEFFKSREVTGLLYDCIGRLTNYWLNFRMFEQYGLPCYYHGNDSGWDNASVFHAGVPVCSPDLAAYLIYQMETLAKLAGELDKTGESKEWMTRADEMTKALMKHLYVEGRFVTRRIHGGEFDRDACSLINYIPLVIYKRLKPELVEDMVGSLEREFETEYGLATESPASRYYIEDGYWLGPIWAPTSYIFIDTLIRAGHKRTAERLSEKFLRLPENSGFYENFNAVTGKGRCGKAFSWTASVYLLLKEDFD